MSELWNNDAGLFELAKRELFTAVPGDAMDRLGLTRQFLPPQIRPLDEALLLIGRAMPVLEADLGVSRSAAPFQGTSKPFGLMLEVLDEVFTAAIEKARAERVVFDQLRQGMGAAQAFAKYGVM